MRHHHTNHLTQHHQHDQHHPHRHGGPTPQELIESALRHGRGRGGPRGGGPRGPRGGGRGYGHDAAPSSAEGLTGWLAGRLPTGWFTGPASTVVDRDEISVVGDLADAAYPADLAADDAAGRADFEAGRIRRFREESRDERVAIAQEAEARYGRTVAWGATVGTTTEVFTNASIPVMTRLRQPERQVLDTLVDAGVARSRSDALAWCVRLVGRNTDEWLGSLREALGAVETARAAGPDIAD